MLKQQTLLRIHHIRLLRRDLESSLVEVMRALEKAAMKDARSLHVRELFDVHCERQYPPRDRDAAHRVAQRTRQLRAGRFTAASAGPTARTAHNPDLDTTSARQLWHPANRRSTRLPQLIKHVSCHRSRRWMLKDERRR